ncbi:CU044_5270 family protein [Actinosynnema sp. CS-041913]|uniref:CU044_5270 family protein n=1 Tax=Actinosynnema sp. CS-041913 TaxID=3239917 RepID=UPI003D8DD60A
MTASTAGPGTGPPGDDGDLSGPDPGSVFGRLFDEHAGSLHGYLARRIGDQAADDLVSETFLVALQQRHTYDPARAGVRPWLYGIAGNLLRRHVRQEVRARSTRACTGCVGGCSHTVLSRPVEWRTAMREGDGAGVRQVWTEDELDRALAALHAEIETDQRGLAAVRENLMAVADGRTRPRPDPVGTGEGVSRRRPLRRRLAAAAAVVVLATAGVVAQTVLFPDDTATARAQEALTGAAAVAARAEDPVLADGQYRYLATHAWWAKTTGTESRSFSFLNENLIETWIPADPDGEWLQRRHETGNRKWVKGTESEARAAGAVIEEAPWPEQRARGGDFVQGAPERGNWQFPEPEFLAGLPTDPGRLYERLRRDSGGGKQTLVYAADALRTGLMPAAARANLLRALTHLPGLDVTDHAADLDGHRGVALGISEDGERQEIILDPGTGEVIGERRVSDSMFAGIPKGTVTGYSSITTAVVDGIGARPAR